MHKSRESIDKQQEAQMGYDALLAPVISGCEMMKCKWYIDKKCADPIEWKNESGEDVCGLRDDAIHPDDYNGC